jgi:hypothetical protein
MPPNRSSRTENASGLSVKVGWDDSRRAERPTTRNVFCHAMVLPHRPYGQRRWQAGGGRKKSRDLGDLGIPSHQLRFHFTLPRIGFNTFRYQ